jgi:hypothetical protein
MIIANPRREAQADFNPFDELPRAIRERLAAEGVHSTKDWLALGEGKFRIFGITGAQVLAIDRLAEQHAA